MHALQEWFTRYAGRTLIVAIVLFIVWTGLVGTTKLANVEYNGLDLAIYHQVSWLTSHGSPFGFTIHPHSYLGDHVEIALAPLSLLVRALGGMPLMLLLAQSAAVALAAWPLFRLAERRVGRFTGLLIAIGYLIHPLVGNIAAFEFHLLPFALPLLFAAELQYQRRRYWPFLLCVVAALTVREDVALVVLGTALLALVDRRTLRWWLPVGMIGIAWFLGALALARWANPDGAYKFFVFYGSLGSTPAELLAAPFIKPIAFLRTITTPGDFLLAAGLLLPLGLVPLARARFLLPALFVALQLFVPSFSPDVVLLTHYTTLLLPALFVAFVEGWRRLGHTALQDRFRRIPFIGSFAGEPLLGRAAILTVWIYSTVTLGPIVGEVHLLTAPRPQTATLADAAIAAVPADASVVASYGPLTRLAGREHVYALHYAFLGHRQYSDAPYPIPSDTTSLIIDSEDFLLFQLQHDDADGGVLFETGDDRIRDLIARLSLGLRWQGDRYLVFDRSATGALPYRTLATPPRETRPVKVAPTMTLLAAVPRAPEPLEGTCCSSSLPLVLTWRGDGETDETYQLLVSFLRANGTIADERIVAFGHGLYPTHDIGPEQIVETSHQILLPDEYDGATVRLQLISFDGDVGVDAIRSIGILHPSFTTAGASVDVRIPS